MNPRMPYQDAVCIDSGRIADYASIEMVTRGIRFEQKSSWCRTILCAAEWRKLAQF
jgi:hypothetical protein